MKNCISINTKKEEIIIKISEKATQKEILECLKEKIPGLKNLYQNEKTPIYVMGKVLKNAEADEIKKVIKEHIDVKINFDSPKVLGLHGIKRVFEQEVQDSETKFHKGSLRSGQKIEFEGSIVVLGDVNGGAEVLAGENIVILGALRGLAHAGAKGNKKAIIASNIIECPQIRIANVVKEIEKNELEKIYKYAYVSENEIILE